MRCGLLNPSRLRGRSFSLRTTAASSSGVIRLKSCDLTEVSKCQRREELRTHLGKKVCDQVSASAIHEGHNAHSFVASLHSVALPVAKSPTAFNDCRPFINTPLLCLLSRLLPNLGTTLPAVLAFLLAQELLQVRGTFVDVPVYGAGVHTPEDTGDLFR